MASEYGFSSSLVIVTVAAVYVAVRPQWQRMPIDNNEHIQFGKMSTCRAAAGRDGKLSEPLCVEVA